MTYIKPQVFKESNLVKETAMGICFLDLLKVGEKGIENAPAGLGNPSWCLCKGHSPHRLLLPRDQVWQGTKVDTFP
jgi:hypothetical protein